MTVHTPIETRSGAVPPWALLLTAVLFLVGGIYLLANLDGANPPVAIPGESAAPPVGSGGEPDPAVGEQLIANAAPQCTSCHGADLAGQASFPSLLGVADGPVSENLQDLAAEHPDNWAELWIAGNNPETEGIDRMGMPEFADQFSPEQIASIVAYLKTLQ
jgi:mono/diheme cytochrome c family protein